MGSERNSLFIGGTEQGIISVLGIECEQRAAGCFSQAEPFARAFLGSAVQKFSRFISAAERAFAERCIDIFGSRTHHRDFRIVNQHGTIAGNRGYKTALHEIDRKSTRLNSSHVSESRMPSSA